MLDDAGPSEARAVNRFERILHLKKAPVFRALSARDLGVVSDYCRERFFDRGGVLLREGEAVHAIFIVVEGTVHLRRRGRDLAHALPGAGVGGLALLARDENGVSAVAETDVLTLELSRDAIHELLEDHMGIFRRVLGDLAGQLIDTWGRRPPGASDPFASRPVTTDVHLDLDLVESMLFLREASPLTWSRISALAELSQSLTEVHHDVGVTLWKEGDPARDIVLLVNGRVHCASAAGIEFTVARGTPLGGLEAVAGIPRRYTARTETPVVGLATDIENLFDVFEDNFDIALDYMALIAGWLLVVLEQLGESGEGPLQQFYGCEAAAQ